MHQSKVSIIIPYNKDRGWLNEAIDSVYKQTYTGQIELIESKSDNGVSYNINRGIELATGDYIKWLPDDDMLTTNCIEDSVKAIEGFDFIHGNALNFFDNGRVEKYKPKLTNPTIKDLVKHNHLHGGTMFYRSDVFERFGLFNESLWTGEEYEYHLRLLSKGASLGYCNEFLFKYRRHDNQKSLGKKQNQGKRQVEIKRIQNLYR